MPSCSLIVMLSRKQARVHTSVAVHSSKAGRQDGKWGYDSLLPTLSTHSKLWQLHKLTQVIDSQADIIIRGT